MNKKIYMCELQYLNNNNYFVKWIDEWRDELIVFYNQQKKISIFSSICPHFGGEIVYNKLNNKLTCKWHGWEFSEVNGKCFTHNIKGELRKYSSEVVTDPNPLKNYKYKILDKKIYALL